ncbi:unnamed protein product [Rotaria sordida]|uniref:Glucosamine/galactosamine-6-phosphate isomerase domain-containing protein n=1 Tax=Rotaria sordida TaxID=392033 RepID=A0A819DIJ8_9BILA|nr:unnamed protein product [Rotaria sordida]
MVYTDTSAYGGKSKSRKRKDDSIADTKELSIKHRKRQIQAKPPSQRVTLTVNTINEAKYKIAVVTYASKSPIVTEILEDNNKTCPIDQLNLLLGISMEQLY